MNKLRFVLVVMVCSGISAVCMAQSGRDVSIYPWIFTNGNVTSKTMAIASVKRITENQGLHVIANDTSVRIFDSLKPKIALKDGLPSEADLGRFAKAVHAGILIFGDVNWHTRSVWVGTGPKTISTATVDVYVYNTKEKKVTYIAEKVEGRSDEKESALKDVLAVLVTPLITAVSGGPATPREQRAVQIAVGRALAEWTRKISR